MAIEAYPTDELGVPLPLVLPERPPDFIPELYRTDKLMRRGARRWTRHHAWFFARHFLLGTPGARVTRFARHETVLRKHHNIVHKEYEAGVPLPENEHQELKQSVLGLAGYTTPEGLQVVKHEIRRIELTRGQRNILRSPGVFTVDHEPRKPGVQTVAGEIAEFFAGYVTSNGLAQVAEDNPQLIEQFRESIGGEGSEQRALEVFKATTIVAVEPVAGLYSEARAAEMLRLGAPSTAARLVMGHIKHDIPDLSALLQASPLIQAFGIQSPEERVA